MQNVTMKTEPHQRLQRARAESGYRTAADAAAAFGWPAPTYFAHENGSRGLRPGTADKYARAFHVDPAWILYGTGEAPGALLTASATLNSGAAEASPPIVRVGGDEYGGVSRWPLTASAGAGVLVPPDAKPVRYTLFRMEWLRQVTTAPLHELAVLEVGGASMQPLLMHGDVALVDLSVHQVHADGIYVMQLDDTQIIKKATVGERGRLTIASINPEFPTLTDVDPGGVLVIGRVFWIGRQL